MDWHNIFWSAEIVFAICMAMRGILSINGVEFARKLIRKKENETDEDYIVRTRKTDILGIIAGLSITVLGLVMVFGN